MRLKIKTSMNPYIIYYAILFFVLVVTFYYYRHLRIYGIDRFRPWLDLNITGSHEESTHRSFFDLQRSRRPSSYIYFFVAVDSHFEQMNRLQIESLRCYASHHNYVFLLTNMDKLSACSRHKTVYYKRHCALSSMMENLLQDSIIFLFDSDVVVGFDDVPMDYWLIQDENFVFYERGFSGEVMAGSYQVINNNKSRAFLKMWAELEFSEPIGFNSADNGAIHIALLKQFDIGNKCIEQYNGLNTTVDNLKPFFIVIHCARQALGMGSFEGGERLGMPKFVPDNERFRREGVILSLNKFIVRIRPWNHTWMHDWVVEGNPIQMRMQAGTKDRNSVNSMPIFYHGVKEPNGIFQYWEKENLTRDGKETRGKYSIYPMCINKLGLLLASQGKT